MFIFFEDTMSYITCKHRMLYADVKLAKHWKYQDVQVFRICMELLRTIVEITGFESYKELETCCKKMALL